MSIEEILDILNSNYEALKDRKLSCIYVADGFLIACLIDDESRINEMLVFGGKE